MAMKNRIGGDIASEARTLSRVAWMASVGVIFAGGEQGRRGGELRARVNLAAVKQAKSFPCSAFRLACTGSVGVVEVADPRAGGEAARGRAGAYLGRLVSSLCRRPPDGGGVDAVRHLSGHKQRLVARGLRQQPHPKHGIKAAVAEHLRRCRRGDDAKSLGSCTAGSERQHGTESMLSETLGYIRLHTNVSTTALTKAQSIHPRSTGVEIFLRLYCAESMSTASEGTAIWCISGTVWPQVLREYAEPG